MKTIYENRKRVTRMMARCTQGVAKVYPRCSQALGRLMSMLRVWLEYAWKQPRVWLEYAYSMPTVCLETKNLFPYGEQNIPTLGTKHSQPGNKTGFLRPFSSKRAELERRLLVSLFLLLVLGSTSVWGQDYSGMYYIESYNSYDANFTPEYYLVPTINCFYDNDEDKPHLTTYKTGGDKNSIWRVEPVSEGTKTYYRLIHNATGKYLVVNNAIPELAASSVKQAHRKRVHLETIASG